MAESHPACAVPRTLSNVWWDVTVQAKLPNEVLGRVSSYDYIGIMSAAMPEMTWLSLRRVLGGFRYAWAERRETAIVTADGPGQTTRGVRGVVICRDERLTEIPFVTRGDHRGAAHR